MRLKEFAVIQQVRQMSHKPPVVESNAEGTMEKLQILHKYCMHLVKYYKCAVYFWSDPSGLPAVLDDLMNVKLKGSQEDVV